MRVGRAHDVVLAGLEGVLRARYAGASSIEIRWKQAPFTRRKGRGEWELGLHVIAQAGVIAIGEECEGRVTPEAGTYVSSRQVPLSVGASGGVSASWSCA